MVQEEVQEIHGSCHQLARVQDERVAAIIGTRATNQVVLLFLHEEMLFLNGTNISKEPCDACVSSTVM